MFQRMKVKSIAEHGSEADQLTAEFLITDAQIALTFLDLAETTRHAKKSSRLIGEARRAYETILSFVRRSRFTPDQAQVLNKALEIIESRLRAANMVVDER